MPGRPIVKDALVAALRFHGWMTARELAAETGLLARQVSDCITDSRGRGQALFVIRGWQRSEGHGDYAPVYGLGPGVGPVKDAKRPKRDPVKDHRERNARYRARNRAAIRARENARRGSKMKDNPFAQLVTLSGVTGAGRKHTP